MNDPSTGAEISGVDYYFIMQDGSKFKVRFCRQQDAPSVVYFIFRCLCMVPLVSHSLALLLLSDVKETRVQSVV